MAKAKKGTVKNCPSIDVVTDLTQLNIPLHKQYALALHSEHVASRGSQFVIVRNAGIQSIFSINTALGINMNNATTVIDNIDNFPMDSWESVRDWCHTLNVRCMNMHYKGLLSWMQYCAKLGDGICLQGGESWEDYRDRLVAVESVAYKVASFIALLAYPLTANLTVCDRWILVACGQLDPNMSSRRSVTKAQYIATDGMVRDKAKSLGYSGPMGIFHWALWNDLRLLAGDTTVDNDHQRFA